jgi:PAS domain S-box-containing protein
MKVDHGDPAYEHERRHAEELSQLYERERARTAEMEAAQEQLREAEAKYRVLVERLPAIVYHADFGETGTWQYVSPQVESILGFSAEEWIADPGLWYRQMHPDDRNRAIADEARTVETGKPLVSEYRMLTRDGRVVWFRDEGVAVPDLAGKRLSLQGIMYDITEAKRGEEVLRRYTERVEGLRQIDLAILSAHTIEDLIGAALSRLQGLVPSRRASVWLIDLEKGTGTFFVTTSSSPDANLAPGVQYPIERWGSFGESVIQKLRGGEVDVRHDLAEESNLSPGLQALRDEGIRSLLVAPMLEQGDLIGVIGLYAEEPEAFSKEQADIAGEVGNQLAIALRQARLRQELEEELAERKRAQEALGEAEAKYRALVENIPAVTYLDLIDPEDPRKVRELYVSPQIEEMLGYEPAEVITNPDMWYQLIHPDDRDRALQEDLRHYETGEPLHHDYRMVARDGRVVWVRDMSVIVLDDQGRRRYAQGVVFDVTERKRAEEALRRYGERVGGLRQIDLAILKADSVEEIVHAAILRLRRLVPADGVRVSLLEPETQEMVVFSSAETLETVFSSGARVPIAALGGFGKQFIDTLRAGQNMMIADLLAERDLTPALMKARDEGIRSLVVTPMLLEGELLGVLSINALQAEAFDREDAEIAAEVANQLAIAIHQNQLRRQLEEELAERKRAEEEIARSEARKSAILESAMDCVITMDHEGIVVEFNPAAEETFGYLRDDAVGKSLADLIIPPSLRQAHREGMARYLETGEGPVLGKRLELTGMRADGTEFPVELAITRVDVPGPPLFTGYLRDITQRKRADQELRQAVETLRRSDEQRQQLLSRLVNAQEEERSRIAGDIHDDTIQVMTAVGIRLDLLRRATEDPKQLALVDQLDETVTLTVARLRNLLFELRPPALDREGLAAALRTLLEQYQDKQGPEYTLQNRLAQEPPTETRVILYRIAHETLSNVRKHARASRVNVVLDNRDGGFLTRVTDDGVGFSLEEGDRYRPGHLGLVSLKERAEMAGGWCHIQSAPGAGTTVEVWVPASAQQEEVAS